MATALKRLVFLILTTAIVVFASEKMYWYTRGTGFSLLVLFYAFPTFVFLWAVETFRVRRLAPLFLCASLFGFIVEGVIWTVVYEGGRWPWNWFHASYTPLAWHAPAVVVIWYVFRRLLVGGNGLALAGTAAAVGVFWGAWSQVYRTPLPGDGAPLLWSAGVFAAYAFAMTSVVVASHWMIGRWLWPAGFRPSSLEKWTVGAAIVLYFVFGVMPGIPTAPVKILPFIALAFAGLAASRRREKPGSLFGRLAGRVPGGRALLIFLMPAAAVAAYAVDLPAGAVESCCWHGIVMTSGYLGMLLFLVSAVSCLLPARR